MKALYSRAAFGFRFLGAKELLELAGKRPSTTRTLLLAETPISVEKSLICLVNLSDYRAFISEPDGRLTRLMFDSNVRDYQGDIEVNNAIRATLENQAGGEDFWWLNNGVTILAAESSLSGKTLTIREPQVVNGLQTSQELHRALPHQVVDRRKLLVRVIEPQAPESYQRIVKATNSQTNVPPASLRATDNFHRNIESYLKSEGLYYERRKNFYRNEGRPWDKIVSISSLAQSVMAILLGRPDDARARPSTLIKNDDDYNSVFNSNYPIQIYSICVHIVKRVESFLRTKKPEKKFVSNLKYHLAMYATRALVGKIEPSPQEISDLQIAQFSDELLERCYTEVSRIYVKLGANDQAAKGPNFIGRLMKKLNSATRRTLGS